LLAPDLEPKEAVLLNLEMMIGHHKLLLLVFLQVTSGAYDGAKLNTVNQAVITEDGSGKVESVSVPLEVMPSGQFEPLYRTPLSVQV